MLKTADIFKIGRPLIMGILNITPDSLSDGGKYFSAESALAHARKMVADGTDIIDIGAESTRPNAERVSAEDELARLVPAIRAVRSLFPNIPISADTYKPQVARAAIEAGADIINDVVSDESGGFAMARVAAELGCGLVITHNSRAEAGSGGFFESLCSRLGEKIAAAVAAGVPRENIIADAGVGFGKTADGNVEIVARLGELRARIGCPILLGVSRKSMFSKIVGDDFADRDDATAAITAISVFEKSADILRVHDVEKNVNALRTARALLAYGRDNNR